MEHVQVKIYKNKRYRKALAAGEISRYVSLWHYFEDGLDDCPKARTEPIKAAYTPTTLEELELVRTFDADTLLDMGCRIWCKTDYVTLWLIPAEWFYYLPDGAEFLSVQMQEVVFNKKTMTPEARLGLLPYGFVQALH